MGTASSKKPASKQPANKKPIQKPIVDINNKVKELRQEFRAYSELNRERLKQIQTQERAITNDMAKQQRETLRRIDQLERKAVLSQPSK